MADCRKAMIPRTWFSHLAGHYQTLSQPQRRLLSHVKQCVPADTVWKACRKKLYLTIASDGGLKDRQGTFGWTLSTPSNEVLYEGAGPIDGPSDVASSTRSEIGGYAAPLLLLTILAQLWVCNTAVSWNGSATAKRHYLTFGKAHPIHSLNATNRIMRICYPKFEHIQRVSTVLSDKNG